MNKKFLKKSFILAALLPLLTQCGAAKKNPVQPKSSAVPSSVEVSVKWPAQEYISKIKEKLLTEWKKSAPKEVNTNRSCHISISIRPNGELGGVNLIRSSGDPNIDRAALQACVSAAPFPKPSKDTLRLFPSLSMEWVLSVQKIKNKTNKNK